MPAIPLLLLPLATAWHIRQARRKNAWLRGLLTFVITRDEFEAHGEGFDVRLDWDLLQRVIETGSYFLFYVGPTMAHIVPKTSLSSPEEIETIRAIVAEALGSKAKLKTD